MKYTLTKSGLGVIPKKHRCTALEIHGNHVIHYPKVDLVQWLVSVEYNRHEMKEPKGTPKGFIASAG